MKRSIFAKFSSLVAAMFFVVPLQSHAGCERLIIEANADPETISPEESTTIHVLIHDRENNPISGVNLKLEGRDSGGKFRRTRSEVDIGKTNSGGMYSARWESDEYGALEPSIRIVAKKRGYCNKVKRIEFYVER